jgi:predicted nucleic acid-binding protein
VILVDAGPFIAAAFEDDRYHHVCSAFFSAAREALAVPALVVAEVCHFLGRAGSKPEAAFLRLFAEGKLVSVAPTPDDYRRMATLVEQYGDLPLGGVDAAVVAIAERLGVTKIATVDRRGFSLVRPGHVNVFTLVPDLSE